MAPSFILLGPVLGAILGALGAIVAAIIGAFLVARLNRPDPLAEGHIGGAENQRDLSPVNRHRLQDQPSVTAANGIQNGHRRSWSL
ncbi:hypothetical protein F5Y10DRAFT_241553 [Nemania abortiva]|nr:hypothetical protein F5Y10DRAFT_241553 [Nemania abortiva]